MTATVLDRYLPFLEECYKNLATPDFTFAKKRFSERPYDRLIKRMRDYAAVEQCLEAEDDVCFGYFLKGRNALWKLDLSLVGPFGIFVRLSAKVDRGDFIHRRSPDLIDFERKVIDMITAGGIKLLTADELQIQVPLNLFNTPRGQVHLYQALFSDSEKLPWQ